MPLDSSLVVVVAMSVVLVGLIATSALLGFQVGRRTAPTSAPLPEEDPLRAWQMPERLAQELRTCLDVADCVVRDADTLSEIAESPAAKPQREFTSAITQLRKTLKALVGRLQQVAGQRLLTTDPRLANAAAERLEKESRLAPEAAFKADTAVAGEIVSAPARQSDNTENLRRFERKPCAGTLKATIYPPPFKADGEPVQCDVITRDLSCGGVGITHTEQLYPRQLIVLHAVTKVLIGEVRWCQQVGERSFVAGCQLVKTGG